MNTNYKVIAFNMLYNAKTWIEQTNAPQNKTNKTNSLKQNLIRDLRSFSHEERKVLMGYIDQQYISLSKSVKDKGFWDMGYGLIQNINEDIEEEFAGSEPKKI